METQPHSTSTAGHTERQPANRRREIAGAAATDAAGPDASDPHAHDDYHDELRALQIELVALQREVIRHGAKVLILLEGRDAAGKDGCIKRITEYMSPRETRVVALGKPSDRDACAWYFQRYVACLPVSGEIVIFNRSWYNRAGVERVMGFCSKAEYEAFMTAVPMFEDLLVRSGIHLLKYYFDIGKAEQKRRLAERAIDPLAQWKISPIDGAAVAHWSAYSRRRNEMLRRTHNPTSPWTIVRADHKRRARLNLIRDILLRLPQDGRKSQRLTPDPALVFGFDPTCLTDGRLHR
jgi:polyphosphate kinase 2